MMKSIKRGEQGILMMDQIHASALFFVIEVSTIDWCCEKKLAQNLQFLKNLWQSASRNVK